MRVWKLLPALVLVSLVGSATAAEQPGAPLEPAAALEVTAPVPAEPALPAAEPILADGTVVGGVVIGGLTRAAALARLRSTFYDQPLELDVDRRHVVLSPRAFRISADLARPVDEALAGGVAVSLDVDVRIPPGRLQAMAAAVSGSTLVPAREARWRFTAAGPRVVLGHAGKRAEIARLRRVLAQALRDPSMRDSLGVARKVVKPRRPDLVLDPVVWIDRDDKLLRLIDYTRKGKLIVIRAFGVATGQAAYPTPRGLLEIADMQADPWWYPPTDSSWARGLQPVPPGPGNPLGTRWMGLSNFGIGIHGTPDAASIGYSASHGCIRMYVPEAEWLFEHVTVGTQVSIT